MSFDVTKEFYSIKEIIKNYHLCKNFIFEEIHKKRLKAEKFGKYKAYRIRKTHLDKWEKNLDNFKY